MTVLDWLREWLGDGDGPGRAPAPEDPWRGRIAELTTARFEGPELQEALAAAPAPVRVAVLRRCRERLPDHPPVLRALAREGVEEAATLWARLAELDAGRAEALTALADLALERGARAEAAGLRQHALASSPGDPVLLRRALALADALPRMAAPAAATLGAADPLWDAPVGDRVPPGLTLVRRIGAGGFGVVFEAIDDHLRRPVALKLLHPHLADAASALETFFDEARTIARLGHPGVVRLHDLDRARRACTMELCAGGSLADRLAVGCPRDPAAARHTLRGPAATLADLHAEGVKHADLKPANLLYRADLDLVVADFGVGAAMAGTPRYRAPEQARGDVGPAVDVHALGRIYTELVRGDPEATPPPEVATWCAEAPEDRPTMREVAASLAPL